MIIADPDGDWKMSSPNLSSLLEAIKEVIKVFTGKIH